MWLREAIAEARADGALARARLCDLLASALARGLDIDCGCFGPDAGTTPLQALGRDAVLLALAVAVYRQHDRYTRPPVSPSEG